MTDVFRTLIIPTADQARAQQLASACFGGGAGMFVSPCSASGNLPATHWISSGLLDAEWAENMPAQDWEWDDKSRRWAKVKDRTADTTKLRDMASKREKPLALPAAQLNGLLARADISDQPPFVALERLGLKLISEKL